MRATICVGLLVAAAAAVNGCSGSSSAQTPGTPIEVVPGLTAILLPTPLPSGLILFRGDAPSTNDTWVTDLSEQGTRMVLADAMPLSVGMNSGAVWNGRGVLLGENPATGAPGIWLSDGTDEGTEYVADIVAAPNLFSHSGVALDDDLLIITGNVLSQTGVYIESVLIAIPLS